MFLVVMSLFKDSSDACRFHRPSRKCTGVKMRRRGAISGVNLGQCRQRGGQCRLSGNKCHCDVSNRILKRTLLSYDVKSINKKSWIKVCSYCNVTPYTTVELSSTIKHFNRIHGIHCRVYIQSNNLTREVSLDDQSVNIDMSVLQGLIETRWNQIA